MTGWPLDDNTSEEALRPYLTRKDELSVHSGCLLWGSRVIVPPKGRELIVKELHESHPAWINNWNNRYVTVCLVNSQGTNHQQHHFIIGSGLKDHG